MDKRDIKRRMRSLLDELDYDFSQFTIDDFTRWLVKRRGREIVFNPRVLPTTIFGAWVKGIRKDFVFYEPNTPVVHQAHSQLHEMCHMLCGHPTVEADDAQFLLRHAGGIDLAAFDSLLLRSIHTDENEQEAEMLASLIQERVYQHARMEELYKTVSGDHTTFFMSYLEHLKG